MSNSPILRAMNFRYVILILSLSVAALAASSSPVVQAPASGAVTIRSEASELASGFASAFQAFGSRPVFLVFERAGKTTLLSQVRAVEASGGVILVRLENRSVHVINARDVVSLTDEGPPRL